MAWCDVVEPRTLRACRIALGQSQDRLVRLDVDQPARARQGRMVRRHLVQREVQELLDAQRIGRAPRDGPLRVQALKIAEQQQLARYRPPA